MLVIFSGGSGVGKNTVIAEFLKDDKYSLMPTYTTREKRPGERDGYPYYFIDEKTFKQKIESGELYEHQIVHGNYYGTSRKLLAEKKASGKILLKDIDVLGTQNLEKSVGNEIKIVTLFLKVNSKEVLVERLTERKEKEIEKRLLRYDLEMSYKDKYDYIINNEELSKTRDIVKFIINAEMNSEKPVVNTENAREEDIQKYIKALNDGEDLQPVKVAIENGKFIVKEGEARYIAALRVNKRVAKEIVG